MEYHLIVSTRTHQKISAFSSFALKIYNFSNPLWRVPPTVKINHEVESGSWESEGVSPSNGRGSETKFPQPIILIKGNNKRALRQFGCGFTARHQTRCSVTDGPLRLRTLATARVQDYDGHSFII